MIVVLIALHDDGETNSHTVEIQSEDWDNLINAQFDIEDTNLLRRLGRGLIDEFRRVQKEEGWDEESLANE